MIKIENFVEKSNIFNNFNIYQLFPINPQALKVYPSVKLHEENYPIRPVAYIDAPTQKISKILTNILFSFTNFK